MAIERKFIEQNIKEYRIKRFIEENLDRVGLSQVTLKKTPLGDKIVIHASRPGLIVGRGGSNIQSLTRSLKEEFSLENPQIEIEEIKKPDMDADIVAERICNSLERFGSARTKGIGHKTMMDTMRAGALGVEILITGKIPSMRARRWRFYAGYLKKAGDLAIEGVYVSKKMVTLKSGAIGVQVRIMPPTVDLPDHITLTEDITQEISVENANSVQSAEQEIAAVSQEEVVGETKEASVEQTEEEIVSTQENTVSESSEDVSSDESADDTKEGKQ